MFIFSLKKITFSLSDNIICFKCWIIATALVILQWVLLTIFIGLFWVFTHNVGRTHHLKAKMTLLALNAGISTLSRTPLTIILW